MSKKDKSLIIYNQPNKGISVHNKRDTLKIGLSIDESDKKDYFKNRIKELEETNRKLKEALNSLSERRDEIKYLTEFRDLFSGHCISGNINKITILQCTYRIKKGQCNISDKCKTRLKILESIEINP